MLDEKLTKPNSGPIHTIMEPAPVPWFKVFLLFVFSVILFGFFTPYQKGFYYVFWIFITYILLEAHKMLYILILGLIPLYLIYSHWDNIHNFGLDFLKFLEGLIPLLYMGCLIGVLGFAVYLTHIKE